MQEVIYDVLILSEGEPTYNDDTDVDPTTYDMTGGAREFVQSERRLIRETLHDYEHRV